MEKEKCQGKNGSKPCGRRPHRPGTLYCNKHMMTAIKAVVNFDSLGLVPDTWNLIALHLSLLQIRSLYLTCKTLYGHFCNPFWFSRNPRYVMTSISYTMYAEQDAISKDYQVEHVDQLGWIPCYRNELIGSQHSPVTRLFCEAHCLIVINSHHKARQIFSKANRKNDIPYWFECRAEHIYENMFEVTRKKICEAIRKKHILTLAIVPNAVQKAKHMAEAVVQKFDYKQEGPVIFYFSPDESRITYELTNS